MGRTGNLSDAHSVLNSFRSILKSLRLADRAGLREHGLGASQVYILHELKNESPLSINDLAARMATDQSTVSVVVAKLIQKGFVTGERSETDARRLDLALTAKGRTVAKRLPLPIQHSIIEGVQQLSAARAKALAEALRDVVSSLGIEDEHPPLLMTDGEPKPAAKKKATTKRAAGRR